MDSAASSSDSNAVVGQDDQLACDYMLAGDLLAEDQIVVVETRDTQETQSDIKRNLRSQVDLWQGRNHLAPDNAKTTLIMLLLATFKLRPTLITDWEKVQQLYFSVGDLVRTHDGHIFVYDNGGYRKFDDLAKAIVIRIAREKLTSLEGLYLMISEQDPELSDRTQRGLLDQVLHLWGTLSSDKLEAIGVEHEGHFAKGSRRGNGHWAARQAELIAQTRKSLMGDINLDDFWRTYASWTATPFEPAGGVIVFENAAFKFDGISMQCISKCADENCYTTLSYPILDDPSLANAKAKLLRFLKTVFHCNAAAFHLYLACAALSVHRMNLRKTLFFIDAGGRGKSSLSTLRQSVWGDLHAFADPSVFYVPEELRKQGSDMTHKLFLTFQEAVCSDRSFLDHLWKKVTTMEPIAVRPPYARKTCMVTFSGLKIWEMNKILTCQGGTYDSVRRRILVIVLKSTFVSESADDNPAERKFRLDPNLQKFILTTQCKAAYMRYILLPFLRARSSEVCQDWVNNTSILDREFPGSDLTAYADNVAETMCRGNGELALRSIQGDNADAHAPDPPNIDAEANLLRRDLLRTNDRLWYSRVSNNKRISGRQKSPPPGHPGQSKRQRVEDMVARGFFARNKDSTEYIPMIPGDAPPLFPPNEVFRDYVETVDVARLREYIDDACRQHNDKILDELHAVREGEEGGMPYEKPSQVDLEEFLNAASRNNYQASVRYGYKSAIGGRRYANSYGAQRMSRAARQAAFGLNTTEVDIHNCFPAIIYQLVGSIVGYEFVSDVAPMLEKYATSRGAVLDEISSALSCSIALAKELALRVFNGGKWQSGLRDNQLPVPELKCQPSCLAALAAAGGFARKVIAQKYEPALGNFQNRKNPVATLTHYVVASIEDKILTTIEEFCEHENIVANSLHFDGLLLKTTDTVSVDTFIEKAQMRIATTLGMQIRMKRKDWSPCPFARLRGIGRLDPTPPQFRFRNDECNCVVFATYSLLRMGNLDAARSSALDALCDTMNATAKCRTRNCITYGEFAAVAQEAQVYVEPLGSFVGWQRLWKGDNVLIHHGAHCVGARFLSQSHEVVLFDSADRMHRYASATEVRDIISAAMATNGIQIFKLSDEPVAPNKKLSKTLSLQAAGAFVDFDAAESDDAADEPTAPPCDELASLIRNEVQRELRKVQICQRVAVPQSIYRCPLCVERTFARRSTRGLGHHLQHYHARFVFGGASVKILHLAKALYNADQLVQFMDVFGLRITHSEIDRNYITRASALVSKWIRGSETATAIGGSRTTIDNALVLTLTEDGGRCIVRNLNPAKIRSGSIILYVLRDSPQYS